MWKYKIAMKFLNACSQFLYFPPCELGNTLQTGSIAWDHRLSSVGLNCTECYYFS